MGGGASASGAAAASLPLRRTTTPAGFSGRTSAGRIGLLNGPSGANPTYNVEPSGLQRGSSPCQSFGLMGSSESLRDVPAATSCTHSCGTPSASEKNAINAPSGDHTGLQQVPPGQTSTVRLVAISV